MRVSPPLDIVHLGKYYPPSAGGIETHTQTLCRALAGRGHRVRVIAVNHTTRAGRDATFGPTARTPDAADSDGPIRVVRAGRVLNVAGLDVTPTLPGILRRVLRDPPDVFHLHTPNVTMTLAVLAHPRVRPLVVTHHSDIIRQRRLKHLVRPLERALVRRAARVLPTSPAYVGGSDLLTWAQSHFPGRVEPLPLGLDLAPFASPSDDACAEEVRVKAAVPGPVWVTVGRLVYYKAVGVALRALRDVPGTLVVIGTGPMEAAWRAEADALGVADRVRWRGRASAAELVGTLRAAIAHWFPSNARSEGFGLAQVEAMAAGCPTINAAVPHSGVAWVCRHDVAGLTVPVDDPAAFAAAARRLLTEPGLRDRLSDGGVREARDRFSVGVMTDHCERIYRAVVRGPGGTA